MCVECLLAYFHGTEDCSVYNYIKNLTLTIYILGWNVKNAYINDCMVLMCIHKGNELDKIYHRTVL